MTLAQQVSKSGGSFFWTIDPKEAGKVTPFEALWTDLISPYLQSQSPIMSINGHDYSYLDRFAIKDIELYKTERGKTLNKEDRPLDINKMMTEHLGFPDDKNTPGLRVVDVISNTIFQFLNGTPVSQVCKEVGELFFIRKQHNCINLLSLYTVSTEEAKSRSYRVALYEIEKHNRPIWVD